jgi:transmembrane sensor
VNAPTHPRASLLLAAAALAGIYALAPSWAIAQTPTFTQEFTTKIGALRLVRLPDGSRMHLNTGSVAEVTYSDEIREVTVRRGEAHFVVIEEPARPFIVHAGSATVHATGAKFSVRVFDDVHTNVLASEGPVELSSKATPPGIAPTVLPVTHLSTDQLASFVDEASVDVKQISAQEAERKLQWRTGMLAFQGETLAEAAQEMNRYHHRKVIIVDPVIAGLRVGGTFPIEDLEGFTATLSYAFNLRRLPDRSGDDNIRLVAAAVRH